MNDEMEIITIDGIVDVDKLTKKVACYALIIIWTIMIFGGIKYKSIIAWLVIAAVFSLFVLGVVLYNATKARCINNKRLEIKDDVIDDLIEVSKHESEDYYVVLRNAGKESILYNDYKEMEINDSVYVFEYFNKKGKCIIRNVYLHKKYVISPELLKFYIRTEEE